LSVLSASGLADLGGFRRLKAHSAVRLSGAGAREGLEALADAAVQPTSPRGSRGGTGPHPCAGTRHCSSTAIGSAVVGRQSPRSSRRAGLQGSRCRHRLVVRLAAEAHVDPGQARVSPVLARSDRGHRDARDAVGALVDLFEPGLEVRRVSSAWREDRVTFWNAPRPGPGRAFRRGRGCGAVCE
jgi:hypothetical protein